MRKTGITVSILAALLLIYLGGSGWFVSHVADGFLTVSQARAMRPDPLPTSPFELGYRGDPKTALGLAFEDITVTAELGPSPAWLVPADGTASIAAIYVHGIVGLRENSYRHLSVLHAAGIATLLITYRNDVGAPLSPEERYAFGLTEWRDLDAAVSLMRERGFQKIVLVGESMGGAIVGQFLMQAEQTGAVAAVVLDSPALDGRAVVGRLTRSIGLPLASLIEPVALEILSLKQPVALKDAVTVDAVAAFPGPSFIAHGTGDRIVPAQISDLVVTRRYGATAYLKTHAGHLHSWHESPETYRRELGAFLAPLLGP